MQLKEVNDKKSAREFILFPVTLYKNDANWIRPLDKDIEQVFNPEKNKAFRHGTVIRWILTDNTGQCIGRVAAFINSKYKTKGDTVPVGGMGFFECINDQNAANRLFDACKNWLQKNGMEAMDGPINFGERDRWWGLQVEGFKQPLYCMNYNPPYYQQLFETYGFKLFFNQYCYGLKIKNRLQDKFYTRHKELASNPDFTAKHITKKDLVQFAKDFTAVYNKAWAGHGGLKQMEEKTVIAMFNSMKPIMDEKISWFVYYKNEPIAFWLNIVDLNQWFKYLNGRFDWWGKLKFLCLKTLLKNKKINGLIFGIIPEFQGQGIDAFMILEGANVIQKELHYEDFELQWIGDFNPKMMNIAESLGTTITRKLITYRYNFDRDAAFHRHPTLI
jgi:hypothetical protein